jgi:TetR/AcrR family transcriptional regulator
MHIMSLCIFPFVGRPVFMHVTGTDMSGFENLMEERKNIIADSVIQLIKK